jgi:hypothetical protein
MSDADSRRLVRRSLEAVDEIAALMVSAAKLHNLGFKVAIRVTPKKKGGNK